MTQEELVEQALRIAASKARPDMTQQEKDDLLEESFMSLLEHKSMTPFFARVGQHASGGFQGSQGRYYMHEEPRLPKMPEKPTLMDFFRKRVLLNKRAGTHLLQSAALAMKNGLPDRRPPLRFAIIRRCAFIQTRPSTTNIPNSTPARSVRNMSRRPTSSATRTTHAITSGTRRPGL
jgi:hypothetical protein